MRTLRAAKRILACMLLFFVARHVDAQPWREMDYGPFLTTTIEVEPENIAYKAIAIRLDKGEGGVSEGSAFVAFDTDTLRYAASWTGTGLIDWRSVVYDGSHGTHPSLVGRRVFVNPAGPGWADPESGTFDDSRLRGVDGRAYGPLSRQWGRWKGLFRHGQRTILAYTIGGTEVLDSPGLEQSAGGPLITRSIQLGARDRELILQVAALSGCHGHVQEVSMDSGTVLRIGMLTPSDLGLAFADQESSDFHTFTGSDHFTVVRAADLDLTNSDFTILATIRTTEGGTIFSKAARSGPWVPDGKTFFIRDGRLCYDIGWVGALQSRSRVNDGQWHQVAATFDASQGLLRLYVDGALQGQSSLRPKAAVRDHVVRIGYTAPNFPQPTGAFLGDIRQVRFYQRRLQENELREPEELWPQNFAPRGIWAILSKEACRITAGQITTGS